MEWRRGRGIASRYEGSHGANAIRDPDPCPDAGSPPAAHAARGADRAGGRALRGWPGPGVRGHGPGAQEEETAAVPGRHDQMRGELRRSAQPSVPLWELRQRLCGGSELSGRAVCRWRWGRRLHSGLHQLGVRPRAGRVPPLARGQHLEHGDCWLAGGGALGGLHRQHRRRDGAACRLRGGTVRRRTDRHSVCGGAQQPAARGGPLYRRGRGERSGSVPHSG